MDYIKRSLNQPRRKVKKKEEYEEFLKTIPGRIQDTLDKAGGELLNCSIGSRYAIIDWRLKDGTHRYNSKLDLKTFMMVECGFCLSNDDKRHNITSMAKTAEEYEERNVIYITRDRN